MCGYTCIRYMVFFFNVIFFISGCGLVGTGAYLRVEKDDDYLKLCDKYSWATGANILIGVGAIILVVAFFGCFGAYKQNSCMLGIFFILLLIIFVCELAAGIYSATERGKVEDELKTCLNDTFRKFYKDTAIQKVWDTVQKKLKCCGIDGSSDYPTGKVPPSCKGHTTTGCYDKIKDDIKNNLVVVIGVGIGFAVMQILGMVMSMWLLCEIKGQGEMA